MFKFVYDAKNCQNSLALKGIKSESKLLYVTLESIFHLELN